MMDCSRFWVSPVITLSMLCYYLLTCGALSVLCYYLLTCGVSPENQQEFLLIVGVPVYTTSCFFLAAFKILSLSLPFLMFWFIVFNYLALSLLPGPECFLPQVVGVCVHNFVTYFFCPLLSPPSGAPVAWVLFCLVWSHRSPYRHF